jgi:hypothetical protein
MLTAEAHVKTDQPSRYLIQLCKHASGMGSHLSHTPRLHADGQAPPRVEQVEWSDTDGIVRLNFGQWTMQAASGALTIRATADDEEKLRRIQAFVTGRLEKVGRRDSLTVSWHQPADAGDQHGQAVGILGTPVAEAKPSHRRKILTYVILGVVGVVALGGAMRAISRLPAWVGALILAVVILKFVAIILGRRAWHRRRVAAGTVGQAGTRASVDANATDNAG